jgi:Tetratricopeptide repeat
MIPDDAPSSAPDVRVDHLTLGRVTWGRNSLRLRLNNGGEIAASLAIRIRSWFLDSGSGVVWEAAYPALVPPKSSGDITLDYFVRPDHGRLQVKVSAEDNRGREVYRESKEFNFEAPYQEEYVLQPYRLSREGVAWDGRILPPFSVRLSEHFIIYYFPGSEAEADLKRIIDRREATFQRLSRELEVRFSGRAILFFYPDSELSRRITGHRGDGWTYGRTVVEVYGSRRKIDPYHEMVHLLASRIGTPPVLFSEGLATSREKNFDNAGRYRASVEGWCRGLLREGALIPLEELMEIQSLGDDLTRPRVAYPESACFVRYLLDRYGWTQFRQAYAELAGSPLPSVQEENMGRFEKIFGVSLRRAEVEWKEWLSHTGGRGVPEEVIQSVVREETVPYLVARGRGLLASGRAEQAEPLLRKATREAPNDLEAQFWLGQALHVRKDYAAALEAYGQVVRLGDRAHLMQVAWSHVWRGQITSAEAAREGIARPYPPPPP